MLESLLAQDEKLFVLINQNMVEPFLDFSMPIITNSAGAYYLVAVLVATFFLGGRRGKIAALCVLLAVAASDMLVDAVIKPLIQRPRPCHELEFVRLLVSRCAGLSFPSAHAANTFCFAMALGVFYRRSMYIFVPLATAVAFSRVYVGVHYPLDVFAGALLGAVLGFFIAKFAKAYWLKEDRPPVAQEEEPR